VNVLGNKKKHKKSKNVAVRVPAEDRRTEAMTVAWMLSTVVTFGALFFSGLAYLAVPQLTVQAGEAGALGVIPALLLAVATVTGIVSAVLMGCAIRYRRTPAPRAIIIASTVICFFPFAVHLYLAVR